MLSVRVLSSSLLLDIKSVDMILQQWLLQMVWYILLRLVPDKSFGHFHPGHLFIPLIRHSPVVKVKNQFPLLMVIISTQIVEMTGNFTYTRKASIKWYVHRTFLHLILQALNLVFVALDCMISDNEDELFSAALHILSLYSSVPSMLSQSILICLMVSYTNLLHVFFHCSSSI